MNILDFLLNNEEYSRDFITRSTYNSNAIVPTLITHPIDLSGLKRTIKSIMAVNIICETEFFELYAYRRVERLYPTPKYSINIFAVTTNILTTKMVLIFFRTRLSTYSDDHDPSRKMNSEIIYE